MSIFSTYDVSTGNNSSNSYIIGRVKRVVLGPNLSDNEINADYKSEKDLGAIYFEILYGNKSGASSDSVYSKPAYPIFSFIRQYPAIGEIVLIFFGPSSNLNDGANKQDLWYMPAFGIWNSVNANPFPNMREYSAFINNQISSPGYDNRGTDYSDIPLGKTLVQDSLIKTLRPFEGDTLIQGRFGQSVRLGSTVSQLKSINTWSSNPKTDGSPITILVNSQRALSKVEQNSSTITEDINNDGSSIYLTSNQAIIIEDINNFPKRSYSEGKSYTPQTQKIIIPEQVPITNDFFSPKDQDDNASTS